MVDYLEGRIEDGCGPAAPQGLMGALALLETVGRVTDLAKLSRDRTLLDTIKNMQMQLQTGAAPRASTSLLDQLDHRVGDFGLLPRLLQLCQADRLGYVADVLDGASCRRRPMD